MKQELIKSKDKLKSWADDGQITPEEDAGDQLKYKAEETLYVVRQNQYQVGEHVIMGFGVVEY